MERTKLLAELQRCLKQLGHDKPIDETTHLVKDLGLESLDRVELIMLIEDEFKLEIPDEDAEPLVSVGVVLDYLQGRLVAA